MGALLLAAIVATGCVPTRKYEEAVAARDLYKANYQDMEHTRKEKEQSDVRIRQLEAQLTRSQALVSQYRQDMERIKTYHEELSARYEESVKDNAVLLRNHAAEKTALESVLASRQEAVWQQERILTGLGVQPDSLDAAMPMPGDFTGRSGTILPPGTGIRDEAFLLGVSQNLASRLSALPADGYYLEREGGTMRLTLQEGLLFGGKTADLQPDGRQALEVVGRVLAALAPMEVTVICHSDGDGSVLANWQLCLSRAGSLVQALAEAGVPSKLLTAAARGMHRPLVPNATDTNKTLNRRTEILLSPVR